MVHLNVSHPIPQPEVSNSDCQHAFVLMGKETLFGVHMTQYHCDKHRYQVILRINLPEEARAEYLRQREAHPDATFIFCNGETAEEKFSIPALGAGNVSWEGEADVMHGNIFFGFRPNEAPPPDWFPWTLHDTIPMIENVAVTVERVALGPIGARNRFSLRSPLSRSMLATILPKIRNYLKKRRDFSGSRRFKFYKFCRDAGLAALGCRRAGDIVALNDARVFPV